jgi:hypothetical protein
MRVAAADAATTGRPNSRRDGAIFVETRNAVSRAVALDSAFIGLARSVHQPAEWAPSFACSRSPPLLEARVPSRGGRDEPKNNCPTRPT